MKQTLFQNRMAIVAVLAIAIASMFFGMPVEPNLASYLQGVDPATLMGIGVGMTTLAADKVRTFEIGDINELPVIAADIIYEGAAVGDNGSGYARPLAAGDPFRGFAERKVDNSTGAAGDLRVRLRRFGLIQLPIASLAITDVGKDVFASDDDTFTLTQGSNTRIGYVERWVSTGIGIIAFHESTGVVTELTDSTGGTGNNELAAVGATDASDVSATINNNFADLAAKVNALIRRFGN